ncbi:hypothetical protein LOK74_18360 [Brevibacillus humidisoli]|uniref:hypothetical protein n=1 Tax=Brevibacillus humidisoli TaxID=2895522 RepID=UPI001E37BE5F|nr:hypothetical protein [Brevibacillus humidisoli]UFJ39983.1 hypothetical protein LOK74_18360 [Brevibacillus humidisoli]
MREVKEMRMELLQQLKRYMGEANMAGAARCAQRLHQVLPDKGDLMNNGVFVAYGGGKDSSYMVAFVRLIQLLLFEQYSCTFKVQVATNRHAGMPQAVMDNIDSVYKALRLYEDPDVETLVIDGQRITAFDRMLPLPEQIRETNRNDMLMTGHRCQGDARPTFCNACNLSMVNSFGVALSYGKGPDIIVTGDSPQEQRAYARWIKRLVSTFHLPKHAGKDFKTFLRSVDDISQHYFADIHGDNEEQLQMHRVAYEGIQKEPLFFSIYEDTPYRAGDHWDLLVQFLGFQFDELAFSFTESDCANPALMAHLRGLKVEQVYGRTYKEGIEEYVAFALQLMRQKDIPEHLIEIAKDRYRDDEAIQEMRAKISRYTEDVYGLTEEHLVCMVFSPFAERAKNLEQYLQARRPDLLGRIPAIHALLSAEGAEVADAQRDLHHLLTALSGFTLPQLQRLYQADLVPSTLQVQDRLEKSPIAVVRRGDPHQAVIQTRPAPDGEVREEIITGR